MSLLGIIGAGVSLLSSASKRRKGGSGLLQNAAGILNQVNKARGPRVRPGVGGDATLTSLPNLGAIIRGGGAVVRGGAGAIRAGATRAATWCRRNPATCASLGGEAAIVAMLARGEAPPGFTVRRRRKGISSNDLKSFRRVANLIRSYSGPVRRMRTCPTRTSRSCR